jgi:hypothetical protein
MSLVRRGDIVVLALALGAAAAVAMPRGLLASAGPTTAPAPTSGQRFSISGTVRDGAGPASGAHVYLLRRGGRHPTTQPSDTDPTDGATRGAGRAAKILGASGAHDGNLRARIVAETETDSNGNFTLSDVPSGRYVIAARAKKEGQAREPIVVGTGAMPSVILELHRHREPTTAPAT